MNGRGNPTDENPTAKGSKEHVHDEIYLMLLSIGLFTISTPLGCVFFCFSDPDIDAAKAKKLGQNKKWWKTRSICSRFQNDIRKRYCGCKWFHMQYYFESGLENLHHVQKMGWLLITMYSQNENLNKKVVNFCDFWHRFVCSDRPHVSKFIHQPWDSFSLLLCKHKNILSLFPLQFMFCTCFWDDPGVTCTQWCQKSKFEFKIVSWNVCPIWRLWAGGLTFANLTQALAVTSSQVELKYLSCLWPPTCRNNILLFIKCIIWCCKIFYPNKCTKSIPTKDYF